MPLSHTFNQIEKAPKDRTILAWIPTSNGIPGHWGFCKWHNGDDLNRPSWMSNSIYVVPSIWIDVPPIPPTTTYDKILHKYRYWSFVIDGICHRSHTHNHLKHIKNLFSIEIYYINKQYIKPL